MTATQQRATQASVVLPNYREAVPLMIAFAPSWPIFALILRIAGTALVIGAGAMWLLPGSQLAPDLMLIKLGVSVTCLLTGLAVLMLHHVDNRPDAYFDPIRNEVRVLQKDKRGRPQSVLRRRYDTLGCVRFRDSMVEIFDVDGSLLMRLPVGDADVRQALRMQLSGTVNITA
ncbi:MAG: hypothetical protein ACK5MY_09850 [Jhaorihella sp.]